MVAEQIHTQTQDKLRLISMVQGETMTPGSCDDLGTGKIYYVQSSTPNVPLSANGIVVTLGTLKNYRLQFFINAVSPFEMYYRIHVYSAWQPWTKV